MLATRDVQHVQLQCSDNRPSVIHLDLDQPDRSSCFCYQNAMLEILHAHAYTPTRLHAYTLTGLHTRTR